MKVSKVVQINGSIVLYKNNEELLKKAINSFLNTELEVKLYLIDNSPKDDLKYLSNLDERIEYIFNNANLGFGKAHNIALKRSIAEGAKYHVVLNPDVYYNQGVLEVLCGYMQENFDVANIMPKVFFPDGSLQRTCRLLPTPADLLLRRFFPCKNLQNKINRTYEMHDFTYDAIINVPFLLGSFMFLRVSALREVGLFDENFFMYLEDTDLCRRLHEKYKTLFFPHVHIFHAHARESYKSKKLLWIHIRSAVYYFTKYGWLFDAQRRSMNKDVKDDLALSKTVGFNMDTTSLD